MSDDQPIKLTPLPGLPQPESLQLRISKMMVEAYPQLMVADPQASAAACTELAVVLGSIMAPIIAKKGMANYREALRIIVSKIHDSAVATAAQAENIAATRSETKTQH